MNKADFISRLTHFLNINQRATISNEAYIESAVLVPLFIDANNPNKITSESLSIYFIRRSYNSTDHAGNIAFPGGHVDKTDKDIIQTASREAFEEIGLQPEKTTIIGLLDDVITLTSKFTITPVLAVIEQQDFIRQPSEVEEIFCVPFDCINLKDAQKTKIYKFDNSEFVLTDYLFQDKRIWGATSRILDNLLFVLNKALKK